MYPADESDENGVAIKSSTETNCNDNAAFCVVALDELARKLHAERLVGKGSNPMSSVLQGSKGLPQMGKGFTTDCCIGSPALERLVNDPGFATGTITHNHNCIQHAQSDSLCCLGTGYCCCNANLNLNLFVQSFIGAPAETILASKWTT